MSDSQTAADHHEPDAGVLPDAVAQYAAKDDLTDEEWSDYREAVREQYRFYIMNPRNTEGVEYSVWYQEDTDTEYCILSSNTGGFPTFASRHTSVGDGIEPSDEFMTLIGTAFHEAMCFTPPTYFQNGQFQETFRSVYDDKPREYEVWAADVLLGWMTAGEEMIPEFRSLVEWAGDHTEFGVPILTP